jgi:Cu/Ag efflux protein CusF
MRQGWWVAIAMAFALAGTSCAQSRDEWIAAKVVKVDAERSRVILEHERIDSIGMDAMTMPFTAEKAAHVERFKAGDKVRFTVENRNDHLLVLKMEPAP